MTRGLRLDFSPSRVAERAKRMIGYVPLLPPGSPWSQSQAVPIRYRLSPGYNGGKDPTAPHPASWSFGLRVPTCDCSGFVCWALGLDRYQPSLGVQWLSTDGLIANSIGDDPLFEEIDGPEVGAVVVYGDRRWNGRKAEGHTGIVTGVPAEWSPDFAECWEQLLVTHCSSSASRRTGAAIHETPATVFRGRGRFLRRYTSS